MKTQNLLILFLLLVIIVPVSATVSLSGTTKFMETLHPGQNVTFPITLISNNNEDYELELTGFTNDNTGGYSNTNLSSNPNQVIIVLDKTNVHLESQKPVTINANVIVPATCNNNLYALINIHPKSVSSTGTSITTAINIPVMITVHGVPINETGTIISTQITNSTIITNFVNTGNHHYYGIKNDISVTTNGITSHYIAKIDSAIVPGGKIIFKQTLNGSASKDSKIISSIIDPTGKTFASSTVTSIESSSKSNIIMSQNINKSTTSDINNKSSEQVDIIPFWLAIIVAAIISGVIFTSWYLLKVADKRLIK